MQNDILLDRSIDGGLDTTLLLRLKNAVPKLFFNGLYNCTGDRFKVEPTYILKSKEAIN